MITIKPHFENDEIINIIDIAILLDSLVKIENWIIAVEWCIGENSKLIESTANEPIEMNDIEFREYYKGIEQTIDAQFIAGTNCGNITISVFDSSIWEIEADSKKLEKDIKANIATHFILEN